ncbi:MAG: ribosome biogenesis/translation initiation ATPase RLI [Candidatus Aenigmatarchaeota archaeon]
MQPRIAIVDKDLCKVKKCGQECRKACPVNRKGVDCVTVKTFSEIDEPTCIGCGICVKKCPFKAITVINLPAALKENPVHRFGKNDFALFRLPIPVKGVVGLLGPNGVGKTTALNILAGKTEPNLGYIQEETSPGHSPTPSIWDELIKINRGTELQSYLEKLRKSEIKVSYKPQNVFALSRLDEQGKNISDIKIDPEYLDLFGMQNIMNRNIRQLSGGELQKLAIAACLTKDADVYYIDEPSSFLDVRQRLNMAKAIRKKAESKHVIVIEHDLATMDFLADNIHVFYGEPGVFGVVSKPYVVKRGINIFLDGMIPEDNVRIREKIDFSSSLLPKITSKQILVSFYDIEKRFDEFEINAGSGDIYRDEILGIFGENGLGKTTFAKMLAGELEMSNGQLSKSIRIAYKPQTIKPDLPGTVLEALARVEHDIIMKLGLERLMEKQVKNLSGGEIQRVAIALTLSKDADLYLLDEPSAFLDVDQRLALAKLLRSRKITCAIIDHDLLFLSYVSDRAMLFTGESGKQGRAEILPVKTAMNKFLKELNITFRADPENKRPRANKPDSAIDREQREKGEYFII